MGKTKKEKRQSEAGEENNKEQEWELLTSRVNVIANPLASRKLTKKLFKVIKKAHAQKKLKMGIREVQKSFRKGEKGFVVLAGNTDPIDVMAHFPYLCEEKEVPYCYVPSKEGLGRAYGCNRHCCVVRVKSSEEYEELYADCEEELKTLPLPV